jgi:hypothetical protein
MNTYYLTFAGGILINAETPEEALDKFGEESTGDALLDAIDEREIYSTSDGQLGSKINLNDSHSTEPAS